MGDMIYASWGNNEKVQVRGTRTIAYHCKLRFRQSIDRVRYNVRDNYSICQSTRRGETAR